MGRFRLMPTRNRRSQPQAGAAATVRAEWYEHVEKMARAGGAFPYVVEGFTEISEAVRRGHRVVLKREQCEVADGITIFDEQPGAPHSGAPPADGALLAGWFPRIGSARVVTVSAFNLLSARFTIEDGGSPDGTLELTPRRLANYVADPARAIGIALGA